MKQYKHINSERIYFFKEEAELKIHGKWIKCIIYVDADNKTYVRTFTDFMTKFTEN